MTCGQSYGCTGECKIAPHICPNYSVSVRFDQHLHRLREAKDILDWLQIADADDMSHAQRLGVEMERRPHREAANEIARLRAFESEWRSTYRRCKDFLVSVGAV